MEIRDFLLRLTKLNRAYVAEKGIAPHKPILLLAVADWFERHTPAEPLLPFDEDLVRLFKENWELLAPTHYPYKSDLITKPFYYLRSEGFWTPMYQNGHNWIAKFLYTKSIFVS